MLKAIKSVTARCVGAVNEFVGGGKTAAVAVGAGLMVTGISAHAAIDVSATVAAIGDAVTAVTTVGAAALVVVIVIKTYKYVKGAL